MSSEAVYATLVEQLETVSNLFPLTKENEVATVKKAFSRAKLVRSRPSQLTVGIGGRDLHALAFVVDLFVPVNTGTTDVGAMADAVLMKFIRGTTLYTSVGQAIHIITSYRDTANRLNDQFHQVSVIVEVSLVA